MGEGAPPDREAHTSVRGRDVGLKERGEYPLVRGDGLLVSLVDVAQLLYSVALGGETARRESVLRRSGQLHSLRAHMTMPFGKCVRQWATRREN